MSSSVLLLSFPPHNLLHIKWNTIQRIQSCTTMLVIQDQCVMLYLNKILILLIAVRVRLLFDSPLHYVIHMLRDAED